jgi:hypothetical protein
MDGEEEVTLRVGGKMVFTSVTAVRKGGGSIFEVSDKDEVVDVLARESKYPRGDVSVTCFISRLDDLSIVSGEKVTRVEESEEGFTRDFRYPRSTLGSNAVNPCCFSHAAKRF